MLSVTYYSFNNPERESIQWRIHAKVYIFYSGLPLFIYIYIYMYDNPNLQFDVRL